MEESATPIFEIGLVLLLAAAAGLAARRIGLPAVLGYLAVGLTISPFTPGYVADRSQLQLLADLGVVLLLFEVGIELDVSRLGREQRALSWAAPVQTVATTVLAGLAVYAFGAPPLGAALLGLAVALSSGVVVVNITRSRRRTTDRPTEEVLLGWSALQDTTGVLIAAVVVGLVAEEAPDPVYVVLGLAAFGALSILTARLLPMLLRAIRREHDLFLIVSVGAGLAIAGVGAVVFAVPLALAAFVAGLAISEGPDTGEARRRLAPFRDVFAVMFFVAIGSLIDPAVLPDAVPWLALLVVLLLVTKTLVTYALAKVARIGARPAQVAVGLSQLGELGFVLASAGLAGGVVSPTIYTAVLVAIVVTIAMSTIGARLVHPRPPEPAAVAPAAPA